MCTFANSAKSRRERRKPLAMTGKFLYNQAQKLCVIVIYKSYHFIEQQGVILCENEYWVFFFVLC